jgi:para-nitrobenzyl esterase
MKKLVCYAALLFLLNLAAMAQNIDAFAVQATIENGVIEGNYDVKTNIQSYLGIPFARPPVGDLRWKAPQPLDNWEGVKETKRFGPRPMQAFVFGDMDFRSNGVSEDCLYLNVWTPAKRNTAGLPVLVYFYGGGFVAGDGSEPRYDGESMAKKGIVAVTVNYRLNVFGFPSSAPRRRTRPPATTVCSTSTPRWSGSKRTSPRSAATPAKSPSPANPPVRSR